MKQNWELSNKKVETKNLFSDLEMATRKILVSRGVDSEKKRKEFLSPDYIRDLHDPFELDEMDKAIDLFLFAKEKGRKVCIYGDYDADGVTSSVLLSDFFSQIGVDSFCYIPDRNKEGYSLNKGAIDKVLLDGAKMIISVDCGVSSVEEVKYAKQKGVKVIILDHHHVGDVLPNADAIVNPRKRNDRYKEKNLAGVGVVFKFVQAVASKIKDYDLEQLKWFLDLVAIGTVADCMALTGENRTLVKFGLIVLSKTRRTGLKQLFHVGRISIDQHSIPSSQQIGFQIGPRINAAGRMDHASLAFDLLASKENEESKARLLALEIEDKNKRRQKVTEVIVKEVQQKVEKRSSKPAVIIEASPNWEIGVVGLAAGKIAEKFNVPTILFQEKDDGLYGSGRSVDDLNLLEIIDKHKDLMKQFGGHAQALGIRLEKEKLGDFQKKIKGEMEKIERKNHGKEIRIDAEIELEEINNKLVQELSLLEPFGSKNERPKLFSRRLVIKEMRVVGNGEKHLKLWLVDEKSDKRSLECIGFGMAQNFEGLRIGGKINVVYNLEEDSWNGMKKIQASLIDIERL
ncbi:MAG: single-stranded-DNA-specific exonuclease RecJ [Patescibacteria group bacterium]|nr:single-stranded-DNA-specific exonuclease RecJ [Patescibacteria group bacterium]